VGAAATHPDSGDGDWDLKRKHQHRTLGGRKSGGKKVHKRSTTWKLGTKDQGGVSRKVIKILAILQKSLGQHRGTSSTSGKTPQEDKHPSLVVALGVTGKSK